MGVCTVVLLSRKGTIISDICLQADSTRALNKLFDTDFEVIQTCIISNCGEFAIIKIGIVYFLPYTDIFQCVAPNRHSAPSYTR